MSQEDILKILDDLTEEEFKRFKFFLRDRGTLKGKQSISRVQLEKADRVDTASLLVQTYQHAEVKELITEVLVKINRNDLAQSCCSGPKEESVKMARKRRAHNQAPRRASKRQRKEVNEPGEAGHPQKSDESTVKDSYPMSHPSATNKKGTLDVDMSGNKDKSVNISEAINTKTQYQRETETLLGRLHLQNKLQHKLSLADFLKIGPPVKQDHETSEKDVAYCFLQRLMMLDYRARYIRVRQDNSSKSVPVFHSVDTEDSGLEALFGNNADSGQSKQTHVHPMDVQMAVFHCSDSFLKQNMMTKLSQCQYALPLLVPDPVTMEIECPLWTFRQIKKTWKITNIRNVSNTLIMKNMSICNAETSMVSFFRLGSLSVSKSQLMNTMINERHSTFFHRNSTGSTKSCHLMNGVAEVAWYCPAGNPNDAFTDCIAFCNLHGDALSIEKQREILIEKSSVVVVLVPTLEKSHESAAIISGLFSSQKPLIVLTADNDCGAIRMKDGKYKTGLKHRGLSDVADELKSIIGEILSRPHTSFQLETMAKVPGIRVDEDDTFCQKGKQAAMKIVKLLQGMNVSQIKDKVLPCQGKLWHEWCKLNKDLYHLKGHIEREKCKKKEEMMKIRQKQCDASCTGPMALFIESLSSLPSTDKEYFMKWSQILIDALTADNLTSILQSYHEKWSEILDLKKKESDNPGLLKSKQTELEELSNDLQRSTFGLEHIFRELGQIYEAHKSLGQQTKAGQIDWSKYPELAAELMILGYPMELMDGDAGHVPLTWIASLLEEVKKKIGDQRVFVLSVLGVQSSGKSTMLNAMFGLQFAVSAGRCTRGAFMQLVKVSDEIRIGFQFDYVLVVDTEGLRSPELAGNATPHHDNELATFVVGLGNMTLINIYGENPSEMQDVLQIVVQAFMRMKKVNLCPSCVFVHQNVTDTAAEERNMHAKRRLQEKLDKMAQEAAKEEVCDAECVSGITAFDVENDVKYFAQLWEGSPPMAPPNPGYSESIQGLKNTILSKASQSAGITLSQFKSKIEDLWNALMNEHFVFSFRNTLEIKVYRKLEVQYGNWTWDLRSNMLTIENKLYTKIENGRCSKVEHDYLSREINKTYEKIEKEMTAYFNDDSEKEMLVQWKGIFEKKIKEFLDELVRGAKRKLDEVIQQKNACKKLDNRKKTFENKLLQKSKQLAQVLKGKAQDEKTLKEQFDSVWRGLVRELTADTKPIEDINLEEDQSTILQELGIEWKLIDESKRGGEYKIIAEVNDYFDYVSLTKQQENCESQESQKKGGTRGKKKGVIAYVMKKANQAYRKITGSFQDQDQKEIRSLIERVEKECLDGIKSKPVATRGYRSTYLQEMANKAKKEVTEFESKQNYALKKEFTVDLLLYVFDRAESWLSESHKKFKTKNDAHIYLESKKVQYYNIFRSFYKGSSSAFVLAELICEKLKDSTVEAVCDQSAIDLATEMRCNVTAFNGNRLNLEKHVLKFLAEEEDFSGFMTYIKHPRTHVEKFIQDKVQKYIFTDHKDNVLNILKKNIADKKQLVSQALFTATETVKHQGGDIDMWLEEFSSLISDDLTFDTASSQNFKDINKFDYLKDKIQKDFNNIIKKMTKLLLGKMKELAEKSEESITDHLCKCCWEKCPFCGAVCIGTDEDHSPKDHSVPFHRSAGINGWHYRNTVEMDVDFCTTNVASDAKFYTRDSEKSIPYKLYRTAGPRYAKWSITPDQSNKKYWEWFVCRFQKQLEDHYNYKFQGRGEIPREWKRHTKEEAIESLEEMYNL
ncbi:interferon-induced very large GTPase 1-like isoform X2 [Toxotes jaculatrix]|uniref:interferon-induced very large GTPase 1-like isoform X2 n=1 Tax=Toxotes jaculatrix TaxID=941984 RepID=UPI001B3ADACD|nr:interferon-induced very large GTPase 1-like isoform X2 [Toxotes jaculatrix]